jgi:hypothetical protein
MLLRQRYVTRMALNGDTWTWYRVSGPTTQQASMAARGQIAMYPRRAERRLKATRASSSSSWTSWQ